MHDNKEGKGRGRGGKLGEGERGRKGGKEVTEGQGGRLMMMEKKRKKQ